MAKPAASVIDPLLHRILSTKRRHGSKGELDFRMWLHSYLRSLTGKPAEVGPEGVIYLTVGEKGRTLFSCHIDTVHSSAESDGSMQELMFDPAMDHVMLANKSSGCLGADDGAGIYILLKMIEAKIPGGYIFNTGEEVGGVGSRAFTSKKASILEMYDRAVAFDRADNYEVICTQGGRPCASVIAGEALASMLTGKCISPYEVSHRGTFTDTKIFSEVISECFNIGVGYQSQHTSSEYQDVGHLDDLLAACLDIPWDTIPTVRKPVGAIEVPKYKSRPFDSQSDDMFEGFGMERVGNLPQYPAKPQAKPQAKPVVPKLSLLDEVLDMDYEELTYLIDSEPTMATAALCLLVSKYKAAKLEAETLAEFLG